MIENDTQAFPNLLPMSYLSKEHRDYDLLLRVNHPFLIADYTVERGQYVIGKIKHLIDGVYMLSGRGWNNGVTQRFQRLVPASDFHSFLLLPHQEKVKNDIL